MPTGAFSQYSCGACPSGTTTASWGDCDDGNASVGTMYCYADGDHDGWAGGLRVFGASCPSSCGAAGLSDKGGDCNDVVSTVHPYRDEVGGNGMDESREREATLSHSRTRARIQPRRGREHHGAASLVKESEKDDARNRENQRDHG